MTLRMQACCERLSCSGPASGLSAMGATYMHGPFWRLICMVLCFKLGLMQMMHSIFSVLRPAE